MKIQFKLLLIAASLSWGSFQLNAQDKKPQKEFRPVELVKNIDRPEGMAVIGDMLYISHYHQNGSIIKYDIARKMVSGKVAEGLNYPSGLLAVEDKLVVLEYGTGSMYLVDPENKQKELVASGFSRPADVIQYKGNLLVSDFGKGIIYQVNLKTREKTVFASGLAGPAGMAVRKDQVHVAEWSMGRISKIKEDGKKESLVSEGLSSPWGLMVYQDELYVTENGSNQISRIQEFRIPVVGSKIADVAPDKKSFGDSISIWKAISMNCSGLDHPEAFCVSERGIYVSEWKSKEVSEILLNSPPSGELLLTGKPKVGFTLTADPQYIQDADGLGPFAYRWQVANDPASKTWEYIDGTTIEQKLKNESLVGQFIRAELSYTDQGGLKEHLFSNALLITRTYAPEVTLTYYPDKVFMPGDTVTLSASLRILDEDAKPGNVEFYSNDIPLVTLTQAPYSYPFVVQDTQGVTGYFELLSIVAKGYDSNGLFGKDERNLYVTNEPDSQSESLPASNAPGSGISVFPNPARNSINIVHEWESPIPVRLINMNKQVMMSAVLKSGLNTLDISKIAPGAYILEYTIGNVKKAEKVVILDPKN